VCAREKVLAICTLIRLRELIASWENSNESQKDFCMRMIIKLGTFSHWRGVFAKENQKSENKFIGLQVITPTTQTKYKDVKSVCMESI
jgi:hypothetical protein